METIDDLPDIQHRATFRTSLLPAEIEASRFWIHDPGVRFTDTPPGPERYVLLLEEGVRLLNLSAGGALARVATPPEIALLRLVAQDMSGVPGSPAEARSGRRGNAPFRDVSMALRIDLRRDLRDILISGAITRTTMLRATTTSTLYELAIRFNAWGNLTGPTAQWYKVRDGSVPPVAAWITQRQLNKAR